MYDPASPVCGREAESTLKAQWWLGLGDARAYNAINIRGATRYIPPRCHCLFFCERTTGALHVVFCLLWWPVQDGKAHASLSS